MIEEEHPGKEEILRGKTLRNSLYYGKDSGQVFLGKIIAVREMIANGHSLYPPVFDAFPGVRQQEDLGESIPTAPYSPRFGRLSASEAAALAYLQDETDALLQLFDPATDLDLRREMTKALGVPDVAEQQKEVLFGIHQFGFHAGIAAGTRDVLLRGQAYPDNPQTLEQHTIRLWWNHFTEPLRTDALRIRHHTTTAIVDYLERASEASIIRPQFPGSKESKVAALVCRKQGIRLGNSLYTEANLLASQFLPSKHP